MTPTEFEALRRRLEEQLRADVELLHEAHRVKLRAFETVLRAQADIGSTVAAEVARPPLALTAATEPARAVVPVPAEPSRRKAWSVLDAIESALERLPEVFDKNDLHRAIGQTPSRATLARALEMLAGEGKIAVEQDGVGRQPTLFRKLS